MRALFGFGLKPNNLFGSNTNTAKHYRPNGYNVRPRFGWIVTYSICCRANTTSLMEALMYTALLAIIIVLIFAVYHALTPKPLPGIPHNKLAWLTGDLPFLIRTAKETGRFSKAFDLSAEKLGPICQVGPTNFLLPSNVFLGEDRHWHGQFLAQQNNWFGAGCDCHFCKSVAHPG